MTTQVESTNKVVKSVEDISHVSTELVDTMQQVSSMSQETAGFATSGQEDLSRMQATMQNMENASKSILSTYIYTFRGITWMLNIH